MLTGAAWCYWRSRIGSAVQILGEKAGYFVRVDGTRVTRSSRKEGIRARLFLRGVEIHRVREESGQGTCQQSG